MDLGKLKASDWLMVGGGVAMLLLGFALPWTKIPGDTGDGPFEYFLTGGIAWLLVVTVGVLALLRATGTLPETRPWPVIFLLACAVATLLMVIRVLAGARGLGPFETSRGIGMYGALVWSLITGAGAYLSFTESGGDIKDLTDVEKLKTTLSGGGARRGDDPPPPPPPPSAD